MREMSWLAILLGVVIGALLAAANAFVGLKVGMTISASIPAAVVSLLVLRTLLKRGTLLENNLVQTIGSAGESVAAGMIFTIPALFIMGTNPAYHEMTIWGSIGGLLGVCFMVPLRRVLIVREHGVLPYPEGVACAEVLQSGERGGESAKNVIWGALVGGIYYLITGLGVWQEQAVYSMRRFKTEAQLDSSPALLGVGYILGVRVAAYMLSGAFLSWFILIPAIGYFGAGSSDVQPASGGIAAMQPNDIWQSYIRFIGAGAVAIGGLISLCKSFPTIISSFWHVASGILRTGKGAKDRTDRDFPFILLMLIIAGLGYAMYQRPEVKLGHLGAIAVIVFAFFFVTVSSRLVGIVGSSSNPASGMTIATLLATALVFKFFVLGEGDPTPEKLLEVKAACISVGALVCIAICVAGDCSQDLKTGYLLKATPWKQQVGEMIGILTSVIAISGLLLLLNEHQGFVRTEEHPYPLAAPQANIMKILADSVIDGGVPWELIFIGGVAAVIVEMLGLPSLPFAVGMYLPLGLSTPIMVGGLVRWTIDRRKKVADETDPGVLTASGLVAGKGLMGVALIGVTALISWIGNDPKWHNPATGTEELVQPVHFIPWVWRSLNTGPEGAPMSTLYWGLKEEWWNVLPVIPFALLTIWLWRCARRPAPPLTPDTGPDGPPPPKAPRDRLSPVLDDESFGASTIGGSSTPPTSGAPAEGPAPQEGQPLGSSALRDLGIESGGPESARQTDDSTFGPVGSPHRPEPGSTTEPDGTRDLGELGARDDTSESESRSSSSFGSIFMDESEDDPKKSTEPEDDESNGGDSRDDKPWP